MNLRRIRKFIFSSRQSRRAAVREAVRQMLLHSIQGDNVFTKHGPEMRIAEQPTSTLFRVWYGTGDAPVRVKRFASIHPTVTFMTSGKHPLDAVTTYFFYWAMREGEPEHGESSGPITVGSDVWIGYDAMVVGGVTLGDGAVIAARALVTKDVAPYEIVGGVPARHIGWRFDEQTREALLKIAWWDWPVEKVLAHRTQLYGRGDRVVDFIARHGGKVDAMTSAEQCEICDRQ